MSNFVKNIKKIIDIRKNLYLYLALMVALILSLVTYHFDFAAVTKQADLFSQHGLNNLYEKTNSIFPPLAIILDGVIVWFLKFLGVINFDISSDFKSVPPFFEIFLLKLRYIILIVISYPLVKRVAFLYTKEKKKSQLIANIWITSPVLVFSVLMQGNNDIYPAIFTLVFLYFLLSGKNIFAAITLGIVAALKSYAVFLFIPIAILMGKKDVWQTSKYLAISVVTYLLPSMLFINHFGTFSKGGREGLFVLDTVIISHQPLNFGIFPILYALIVLYLIFFESKKSIEDKQHQKFVEYSFITLSLFYVVTMFYPQWFLWILPFMVLIVYRNRKLFTLYTLLISAYFLVVFFIFNNNLDASLFKPILNNPLNMIDVYRFTGLEKTRVVLLAGSFFIAIYGFMYYFYKKEPKEENLGKYHILQNYLPLILYLFMVGFFVVQNYL